MKIRIESFTTIKERNICERKFLSKIVSNFKKKKGRETKRSREGKRKRGKEKRENEGQRD